MNLEIINHLWKYCQHLLFCISGPRQARCEQQEIIYLKKKKKKTSAIHKLNVM